MEVQRKSLTVEESFLDMGEVLDKRRELCLGEWKKLMFWPRKIQKRR